MFLVVCGPGQHDVGAQMLVVNICATSSGGKPAVTVVTLVRMGDVGHAVAHGGDAVGRALRARRMGVLAYATASCSRDPV